MYNIQTWKLWNIPLSDWEQPTRDDWRRRHHTRFTGEVEDMSVKVSYQFGYRNYHGSVVLKLLHGAIVIWLQWANVGTVVISLIGCSSYPVAKTIILWQFTESAHSVVNTASCNPIKVACLEILQTVAMEIAGYAMRTVKNSTNAHSLQILKFS